MNFMARAYNTFDCRSRTRLVDDFHVSFAIECSSGGIANQSCTDKNVRSGLRLFCDSACTTIRGHSPDSGCLAYCEPYIVQISISKIALPMGIWMGGSLPCSAFERYAS
jgi:hypothetical protein